jgi:nicotinate-nucleotide adenylyltransferase
MTGPQERIGILGGTFNPVHVGHLRAAEEVVEALGLERMLFVPSSSPPHKSAGPLDPIASPEQRLEWLRLATRDNPHFEVDALEIERGGASFSVETLTAIGARIAPERPVFTIGQDAFVEVDSWREPERLFELASFAVITRPPVELVSLSDWMPRCIQGSMETEQGGLVAHHKSAPTWIRLVDVPGLDVSSSDIRLRLREGRSVRYLLPASVQEAVEKSGTYGANAAGLEPSEPGAA